MKIRAACMLFLGVFFQLCVHAQHQDKTPGSLKSGTRYTFTATHMYPVKGMARNLTAVYEVRFSSDTLYGQLPYMGEAYQVDYGSADVGVNLSTAQFTYTESVNKKGARVVSYRLKNSRDATTLNFTLYNDGTADLQILFLQRQPVSYRGAATVEQKSRG